MTVVLRPATLDDVVAYTGSLPFVMVRAWAGEMDGKIIGIGGLAYLKNGAVLAFMNTEQIARERCKVSLVRAARTAIKFAMSKGLKTINAIKADDIEAAERFLARLGFHHAGGGVFVYVE